MDYIAIACLGKTGFDLSITKLAIAGIYYIHNGKRLVLMYKFTAKNKAEIIYSTRNLPIEK